MAAEIFAGLSAIKTAFDMAKGLQNIHDTVARDRAIIDLQRELLDAQTAQADLVETASKLKARVAELEAWDEDKKRYKLTEIGEGLIAYTLKDGMENGEPSHHLCASCFHDGHKSIMQSELRFPGRCEVMVCHRCGSELYVTGARDPDHAAFKRKARR
jgi:hypothetical protein